MFSRSGRTGNYAYTVSRVKAKKGLLLKDEDYNKMLQMAVPEVSRYISESGYQKEMSELAGRIEGIDLVEHATYANMAKVFSSILQASQGELHTMVAAYLEKWDIWNLKVILRGKSYGLSVDEVREDLVPAGSLKSEDLEKLMGIENVDDILANYSKMVHVQIPQDVMNAYKANGNLGEIEDYLDKFHWTRLLKSINPSSRPTRMFQDYVRMEIDVINLETILKLKDLDECCRFFDDLCTPTELRSLEQRFDVAVYLQQGLVYLDILEKTGASSATISRVNRSLLGGAGGYESILEKMKESGEE